MSLCPQSYWLRVNQYRSTQRSQYFVTKEFTEEYTREFEKVRQPTARLGQASDRPLAAVVAATSLTYSWASATALAFARGTSAVVAALADIASKVAGTMVAASKAA